MHVATRLTELAFFFAVILAEQGSNVHHIRHAGSQESTKACGIVPEYVIDVLEGRGATDTSLCQ